ncbi:MAG: PmoA family protein [Planctomycetia bacterium]|nr:PmoA family protein [Planctomycetia bacterium]
MKRRDFFKNSGLAALGAGFSVSLGLESASAAVPDNALINAGKTGSANTSEGKNWGDKPVEHFTTYFPDFADNNIWVRRDNQVFTCYRTGSSQKYPYFYPLTGPVSRASIAAESAMPWPHHRGVFLGIDRVNGGNYWQMTREDGQVLSQGPKLISVEKDSVEFTDSCLWKKPEQDPIIEDNRRYVIQWRNDNLYTLDLYYDWNALVDVEIQKTNHGFFGIRVEEELAPWGGGNILTSEGGTSEADSAGKPANWVSYYGKRRCNPDITEGVAVFCPDTPFAPHDRCPWFVRDYGNISPMPFLFVEDGYVFKYPKGTKMSLAWRVAVFAGTPAEIDLNGLWKEFYNK